MPSPDLVVAVVSSGLIVLLLSLFVFREFSMRGKASLPEDDPFWSTLIARSSNNFNPKTATLVLNRDDIGSDFGDQANRIYRTENGDYYLFVCNRGSEGFISHLNEHRVKNALRSVPKIFKAEFPNG